MSWEYLVEEFSMADRWSNKAQAREIVSFGERLNQRGKEGWELVSYESIPLYGAFSSKLKGYAYLLFFKRPNAAA